MTKASPFLRAATLISLLTFLTAISLQLYSSFQPRVEPSLKQPLADILPKEMLGWEVKDLPLAQSPEASARVEDRLGYDDTLFRAYRQGRIVIWVYISYWTPGKESVHSVSLHTPDTCWVFSGWKRKDRAYATSHSVDGHALKPVEYGVYQKDDYTQSVIFWHLANGDPFNYSLSEGSLTLTDKLKRNFWLPFKTIFDVGFGINKEQFFIRISSNAPIDILWDNQGFKTILRSMEPLGIFQEKN